MNLGNSPKLWLASVFVRVLAATLTTGKSVGETQGWCGAQLQPQEELFRTWAWWCKGRSSSKSEFHHSRPSDAASVNQRGHCDLVGERAEMHTFPNLTLLASNIVLAISILWAQWEEKIAADTVNKDRIGRDSWGTFGEAKENVQHIFFFLKRANCIYLGGYHAKKKNTSQWGFHLFHKLFCP